MAEINNTGIIPKTLESYRSDLVAAFQAAFGADIDTDPQSPQGQYIDQEALAMSQADDALVVASGGTNIYKSFASQLEGIAAIIGIRKRGATGTTVTATLGGTPGFTIPAGSRARSTAGDFYALDEDADLGVLGSVDAQMTCTETGPIELGAGELTAVVDVVPGWETVTNAATGLTGTDAEKDSEYRQRYFRELFKNALSVLDSIVAQVSAQDGVTDALGVENDTTAPIIVDGVTIPAHTVVIVVEGGLDEDIKDAIRLKKTGGTGTDGTTTVLDPPNQPISFYRVSDIEAEVSITTTPGPNFPGNGLTLLKERVFNYVNGAFAGSAGEEFFETDGMQISEDLDKNRLYTPINSVPGHTVSGLTLEDKANPGDVSILTSDLNEKIKIDSLDDVNVTLL